MSQPAALVGNLLAAIGLAIGGALLVDYALSWFGGAPFALCAVFGVIDLVLGRTVGMLMIWVGLVAWVLSGMRQGGYLALVIGGFVIYGFPTWFAEALGARCGG